MTNLLENIRTDSSPSDLKITDMRFADLYQAPMHCTLVRIDTNQGISGFGELRDFGSRTYAAMLKSRILGENPCNINRIFSRIKQFGGPGRQGGGVSGIEIALCDLAGKAYGIPVYQMLGGKFRDTVRVYCDLGRHPRHPMTGEGMGAELRRHIEEDGFTMVKCILGIENVQMMYPDEPILSGFPGFVEKLVQARKRHMLYVDENYSADPQGSHFERNRLYESFSHQHPYTFMRITEHGLDRYEEELSRIRTAIGYQVPLAVDHLGHVNLEDMARLLRRLEKYNLAWAEDPLPCTFVEEYKRLSGMTATPMATGEDLYLKEGFYPLCKERAVPIIHPDVCSCGGIFEMHRIGNMALEHHMSMICHMCETPVAALATAHVGVATENFIAMEFNAPDDPWWNDILAGGSEPIIKNGFITPEEKPGLGFDNLNDEVLEEHRLPHSPPLWTSTDEWNFEYSNDRTWS